MRNLEKCWNVAIAFFIIFNAILFFFKNILELLAWIVVVPDHFDINECWLIHVVSNLRLFFAFSCLPFLATKSFLGYVIVKHQSQHGNLNSQLFQLIGKSGVQLFNPYLFNPPPPPPII